MDIDHLVHMANQIGEFFQAWPDQAAGKEGVVQHLKKFWAPSMRRALLAQLDADGVPELSAFVRSAIEAQRSILQPD